MKRMPLAVAACLAAALTAPTVTAATAPAARVSADPLPLVRVNVPDAATGTYVANYFDETHEHIPGQVEIVLWPGDAARLTRLGLTWTVVSPDLRTDRAESTGPDRVVKAFGPERSDYRRLPDFEAELKSLAKKYPKIVKLITFGEKTREGRTVYGIEIASNVKAKDGRPTFLVDGVHHAREWPAGEYPMFYAYRLVEGYGRIPQVTSMLKKLRVVVVPVVNVDGFNYSREAPVDGNATVGNAAYWRKNRRSFTGMTLPAPAPRLNPDAYGVDPNRNYGYMWGDDIGGSSEVPADETHRGDKAFSEPESRNIEKLLLGRSVTALVTNHTSGRLVMHPWGWSDDETPSSDEKIFQKLGEQMADLMGGYENISAYELYYTSGGSRDWAYGALGTLAYTYEHGTAFHPPYATGVALWSDVLKAYDVAANAAINPKYHSVITGTVLSKGRKVNATLTLTKKITNPLWPGNPSGAEEIHETFKATTETGGDGAFAWHVNPSTRPWYEEGGAKETYTLTVAYGGKTRTFRILAKRGQTVRLGTIRL